VVTAAHRRPADAGQAAVTGGGGTIRGRVSRILALPAVVVLLLLAVVAAEQVQDYRESRSTSRSVTLTLAVQDLVHALQTERGVTAGVLGGNTSFEGELEPARRQVDAERAVVQNLVSSSGDVESQIRAAVYQLDGLRAVRAATDGGTGGRAATFDYFTDRISALSRVDVGLDRVADDQLRRGSNALQALQDLSEAIAQERAFLNGVFSAGGFADDEFVQFAAMRAAKQAALERFNRFATAGQREAGEFVFDTGPARVTTYFENVAADAYDGRNIVVNPQSWWSGLTTVLDDLRQLQQHVGSEIQSRAHSIQTTAGRQIGGLLVVVLLCFAGSVYLVVLASLAITRPLAALAAEANSVAIARLPNAVKQVQSADGAQVPPPPPVQVPARATEEIRSVATALDNLQEAAYDLATEQAVQRRRTIESLANLGRRNQNLIRRQLGFITSLEREEIDPAALANLFELDHLATRMRRNASSLLVLVGASSPRQWSTPVPVADVIRAAVSEVEEYRRVALRRVDDAAVVGNAVGATAHLLSELIENGLTFSPPDSEVEVQGRWIGDGYLIAITDQGIGMSEQDLQVANARLRGEDDFIAAPTRFLGHFVVGQLARETGISVELRPSPVTGITARVTVPAGLLSMQPSVDGRPMADATAVTASAVITESRSQLPSGLAAIPELESAQPRSRRSLAADWKQEAAQEERPVVSVRSPSQSAPYVSDHPSGAIPPQSPSFLRGAEYPLLDDPPANGDSGAAPGERTRNGLRKRTPRSLRAMDDTGPAPTRRVERAPVVDDSPAQVRNRLTALRTGLERGQMPPPASGVGDGPGNVPGGLGPQGSANTGPITAPTALPMNPRTGPIARPTGVTETAGNGMSDTGSDTGSDSVVRPNPRWNTGRETQAHTGPIERDGIQQVVEEPE
jgi:hypothetical protein